ncbi:hypothetical protein [Nocardiopsis sp. Huas11]|uniref:hypothetical protein n=1 Tax=Nocardiopsis sp. Huas11 TaxID=2183912 RepID=UPI0011C3AAFF|nr:hypothetical protein [Nocardiopsis sp. Huas11]
MGAWRDRPAEWPMGMPSPTEPGWQGWALHWLSAHAVPLWLTQAATATGMPQRDTARLAWRLRTTEARALEASTPWMLQSLTDAGIPADAADEIGRLVADDIDRRRERLADLESVARHL